MYITESNLLPIEVRKLLDSNQPLEISGLPLNHWQIDGKEFHYYECNEVIDMPFVPHLTVEREVNPSLNRHLHPLFSGLYVVIIGHNPETKDEYAFGVKDELKFCLQAITGSKILRTDNDKT